MPQHNRDAAKNATKPPFPYEEAGQRLKQIRNYLGLHQETMASEMKIPLPTYKGYERGRTSPSFDLCKQLALRNVNINWLLTGEGSMWVDTQINATEEDIAMLTTIIGQVDKMIDSLKMPTGADMRAPMVVRLFHEWKRQKKAGNTVG